MRDIPLHQAVIAFCPASATFRSATMPPPGSVAVFSLGDRRADKFEITLGACESHWREHPNDQWPMLLHLFWHMVRGFGLDVTAVDTALSVIPEYRAMDAAP